MRDKLGRFMKGHPAPKHAFKKGHKPSNLGIRMTKKEYDQRYKLSVGIEKYRKMSMIRLRKWRARPENRIKNRVYYKRMRAGGKLPIKRIQMVYEDNIKEYGTLTCVYCLLPLQFGKDSIDHIIPLSKGGTNSYENLTIACRSCNSKKGNKIGGF